MNRRILLATGAAALVAGGAAVMAGRRRREAVAAAARAERAAAAGPEAREIVRLATLAPNSHNTQPWRFHASADGIAIAPDFARRTPAVDPDDHHLYVSLGAAAETAAIAAAGLGRPAEVTFEPGGDGRLFVALASGAAAPSPLFAAIPARQSTRAEYDARPLSAADLDLLAAAAAAVPGVEVAFVTDPAARNRIGALVIEGNDAQVADRAFVAELVEWLRFDPAEALATRDGLYAAAVGSPTLPGWIGRRIFPLVFTRAGEARRIAAQVASSAGFAVFFAEGPDGPEAWSRVGRAFQRLALQATALGIRSAHLNQPLEVAALRPALAAEAGAPGRRPHLLIRLGRGPLLPFGLRRPPEAVMA